MNLVAGSSLQPSELPALHGAAKHVEASAHAIHACHTPCFSLARHTPLYLWLWTCIKEHIGGYTNPSSFPSA